MRYSHSPIKVTIAMCELPILKELNNNDLLFELKLFLSLVFDLGGA